MVSGFLSITILLSGASVLLAQSDVDPSNVPPVEEFLELIGGEATVIGNRVYYDGGEVFQRGVWVPEIGMYPMNATLSIDLSQPWSPEGVVIDESPKDDDMPIMTNQNLWTDEKAGEIYTWGGWPLENGRLPQRRLRKFTPTGAGGSGTWSDVGVETESKEAFRNTGPSRHGAFVSTPTTGFIFGGEYFVDGPSPEWHNNEGYIAFDFATRAWRKHFYPDALFTSKNTLLDAVAVFVPEFGSGGLIFSLGGASEYFTPGSGIDFGTAHFFDPVEERWFSQNTTGDIPTIRTDHCAVGVAGANGTFDIFVYGGYYREFIYSTVYVLSLPGFKWTLLYGQHDFEGRFFQACAVIGDGQRQLLSWGGTHMALINRTGSGFARGDRNPRGLAIFDLAEGEWKTRYDPDAAPYRAHQSVSEFHTEEELNKVEWSSDEVKAYFAIDRPNTARPGGDGVDQEVEGAAEPGERSASPPIGAIVGGVLGGVALVAGAFVAFCLVRRRNRRREVGEVPEQGQGDSKPPPVELNSPEQQRMMELDGNAVSEVGYVTEDAYQKAHAVEVYGDSVYYQGAHQGAKELDAR